MVHYFISYFQILKLKKTNHVAFALPTGAMGNSIAGLLCMKMGLPITRLVLGQNINNPIYQLIETNTLVNNESTKVIPTIAPAIDILVPYNVERLVWILSGFNFEFTKEFMRKFLEHERIQIENLNFHDYFTSSFVENEGNVLEIISKFLKDFTYCMDPHTAYGMHALLEARNHPKYDDEIFICFATAHPSKFPMVYTKKLALTEGDIYTLPKSLIDCTTINPKISEKISQHLVEDRLRKEISLIFQTDCSRL